MPLVYRWTHDDSREPAKLAVAAEASHTRLRVEAPEGVFVGGAYQLGMGVNFQEIVHLDVAHSEPPEFNALRGLWGTLVRPHVAGAPLVPVKRLYLESG